MDITHPDVLKPEQTGGYRVMGSKIRRCFGCGRMIEEDSEEKIYDGMGRVFCNVKCRMKRLKRICAEVKSRGIDPAGFK